MKDDFLIIPDAPNYEINSELICRNKKSGRILTLKSCSKNNRRYSIYLKNQIRSTTRSARVLRAQAVAAVSSSTFEPILSLNGKYEINIRGVVRNARTKKIIKPHRRSIGLFNDNHVRIRISVADLLWETHGGIIPVFDNKPISCAVENNQGKHFFKSLKDAARFLAPKVLFAFNTVSDYLCKRKTEICGWKITYLKGCDTID